MNDVVFDERIHVMDDWLVVDLESLDGQVTTKVTRNHVMSNKTPLPRCIELLIDPAIRAEGCAAHLAPKREISKPLEVGRQLDELRIRFHRERPRNRLLPDRQHRCLLAYDQHTIA